MNAQRLGKMLSNAWHISRNGTQPMHRCAHVMIADGLLSITATDGFRLLRQVEVMDAPYEIFGPTGMFAVNLEEARLALASAVAEANGRQSAAIWRSGDHMIDIELSETTGNTILARNVRLPIAQPPDAERTAWTQIPTAFSDHATAQWASITDAGYARKAIAVLKKNDRCYLHMDAGWLNVWRHAETRVSAVTTLEKSSYTERTVVLTAPAPDAVATRVRVNPQWLQQAMKLFSRTAEVGLRQDRIVVADRREAPHTVMVIMAMRPERGDE